MWPSHQRDKGAWRSNHVTQIQKEGDRMDVYSNKTTPAVMTSILWTYLLSAVLGLVIVLLFWSIKAYRYVLQLTLYQC